MNLDAMVVAMVALGLIFGTILVYNKYKGIFVIVEQVSTFIPQLSDMIGNLIKLRDPRANISGLEKFKQVSTIAVDAVEQVSKKGNMSSKEKKELAIKYCEILCEKMGICLSELDKKSIDILIENAVSELNHLHLLDNK